MIYIARSDRNTVSGGNANMKKTNLTFWTILFLGPFLWFSIDSTWAAPQESIEKKEGRAQPEVPKKTNGKELPAVEIPSDKQQLIGVKKVEATVKPLQRIIRTVGRIEYDERKLVTVNLKVEGWIERLYGDFTGKYVKKGEPLAEIYSPELFATQLEYLNLC